MRGQADAAIVEVPSVLDPDVLAIVLTYPDQLLISWLLVNPHAHDALTERERAHTLGLIRGQGQSSAATYVRERLRTGDHVQARGRIALENGAIVKIDGRTYYVERRTGERTWRLRGTSRGVVDLTAPHSPAVYDRWSAWIGGVAVRSARLWTVRRDATGHFARIP